MATITLNDKQLHLIQTALDLYSRIGILQFEEILQHPTIDSMIEDRFTDKKKLEIGDHTMRGEIVEIGDGFIKTKGLWNTLEEIKTWKDVDKVKLSPDWDRLYETQDIIRTRLNEIKHLISGEHYGNGGSLGIHNTNADETCREAYDMIQVIRHEFWKADIDRTNMTVDSDVIIWTKQPAIEVKLDPIGYENH
jgi:hypothetical protein